MKFQSRAGVAVLSLLLASTCLFVCYSPIAYAGPYGRPESAGPDIPTEAEQALFTKGQTLYTQGLYSEAIATFSEFLQGYPNSLIKDLNLLWLGRSYLRAGNIAAAEKIGVRLREIADTSFTGMYEEELRIARQSYVKSAASAFIPAKSVPRSVAPSPLISVNPGTVIPAGKPKSSASPSTPATISKMPPRPFAVVTNQGGERDRVLPGLAAKVPFLRLRVEEMPRVAGASGVVFYRLVIVNEGRGAARDLIVREELDSSLDFASSDPAPSHQEIVARSLVLTFRLPSLEAGASRSFRIAVRPRPDANAKTRTVNTLTQIKQSATYRDTKGNPYHTP